MVTVVPSNSPTSLGNLKSSSASSSVMVSILLSEGNWANRGLSLSSALPICATGPKRPIFTYTGRPVFTILAQFAFAGFVLAACIHDFFHFWLKTLVEVFHPFVPFSLSCSNIIKLLLYVCCKVIVHDAREVGNQEVIYHDADICREELPFSEPAISFLVFWVTLIPFRKSTVNERSTPCLSPFTTYSRCWMVLMVGA